MKQSKYNLYFKIKEIGVINITIIYDEKGNRTILVP